MNNPTRNTTIITKLHFQAVTIVSTFFRSKSLWNACHKMAYNVFGLGEVAEPEAK